MKLKRIFSLFLCFSLLAALLAVPTLAVESSTLTLREDWRLTSNLDLNVPEGTTLTINGGGHYIYELGGTLQNSGLGTVTFAEGTILYPTGSSTSCTTATSNALMAERQPHIVTVGSMSNGTVTAAGSGTSNSGTATAKKGETVTLAVTPAEGYQLNTLTVTDGNSQSVTVANNTFSMPASAVTVSATFKQSGSGGTTPSTPVTPSQPSTPTTPTTTTETVTNEDGSTTTTVTDNKTGTVTETTTQADGSTTVVETKTDGTVSTTATDTAGNQTETVSEPSGTVSTTETRTDGVTVSTVETAEKEIASTVAIPETVEKATVTIPTQTEPTQSTVAVIVHADGTEEIVKTSIPTEDGVKLTLTEGATLKIVDNSKDFEDVEDGHWAEASIDFISAREMMVGTGAGSFSPEATTTRSMLMTLLARLDGADTEGGETWYEKGMAWAVEKGVSDGTSPEAVISREQLATMLYRYAGQPETSGTLADFGDADETSGWAETALRWCVEKGIMNGKGNDVLDPKGSATRAQVAAMLERYVKAMAE